MGLEIAHTRRVDGTEVNSKGVIKEKIQKYMEEKKAKRLSGAQHVMDGEVVPY